MTIVTCKDTIYLLKPRSLCIYIYRYQIMFSCSSDIFQNFSTDGFFFHTYFISNISTVSKVLNFKDYNLSYFFCQTSQHCNKLRYEQIFLMISQLVLSQCLFYFLLSQLCLAMLCTLSLNNMSQTQNTVEIGFVTFCLYNILSFRMYH